MTGIVPERSGVLNFHVPVIILSEIAEVKHNW